MKYDFDEIIDRKCTDSIKWDVADGELPMWVADMDFRMLPSARAVMEDVLKHGIFGYTLDGADYKSTVSGWYSRRFALTANGGKRAIRLSCERIGLSFARVLFPQYLR